MRGSAVSLHLMLKITPTEASAPCTYAKILGIKKSHSQLIRHLHHSSDIPVIQKISQYPAHLEGNALHSFEQTLTATTLYRYAVGKSMVLLSIRVVSAAAHRLIFLFLS